MGGCRCTYRNCTSRTDGNTHLFHYPVFNRSRCHQWLVNADRLDFLELKLSQLKNRVICQHHFTDDDFMNCLKSKLKPSAVPVLQGPNCNTTSSEDTSVKITNIITHKLTDIEELRPKEYLNLTYNQFLKKDFNTGVVRESYYDLSKENNMSLSTNFLSAKVKPMCGNIKTAESKPTDYDCLLNNQINFSNQVEIKDDQRTNNRKIKILSQKVIDEPIRILPKELTPISCTDKLRPSNSQLIFVDNDNNLIKQCDVIINSNPTLCDVGYSKSQLVIGFSDNVENDKDSLVSHNKSVEVEIDTNSRVFEKDDMKSEINVQSKSLLIDNLKRISNNENATINKPTKVIKLKQRKNLIKDIEEKRKFNMKLRDVLEAQVTEIGQDKLKIAQTPNKLQSKLLKKRLLNRNIVSYLSEEPDLPSKTEFNFSALESRIKKMENLLLHKIEQNSERIVELKSSLSPSSIEKKTFSKSLKKSVCTQSSFDEEAHKKQLYQDIVKYLSPDVCSLVYEELFINKYAVNTSKATVHKRKRR